jgi:hypothetical protein
MWGNDREFKHLIISSLIRSLPRQKKIGAMGQSPQLAKLFHAIRNCELPTAKLRSPEANPQFVDYNADQLIS